jgi:hypothetical protein
MIQAPGTNLAKTLDEWGSGLVLLNLVNVKLSVLCHLISSRLCKLAILPTCCFANLPFCQFVILPTWYFVNLSLCELGVSST